MQNHLESVQVRVVQGGNNKMDKLIGVIDEPVPGKDPDELDINVHTNSLIKFIEKTNTPITIGIQGEWGSGKTSLINSIHHHFEGDEKTKQIWINSWEYSLLSTPEEALLKIINRIIDELIESDPNETRKKNIKGGAEAIFKGALRVGAQVALGNAAGEVAKELLDTGAKSIAELRKQLSEVVEQMADRSTNPYETVVIYVDDLDRIEPKNAVAILELLKNIFSVPKCIFILAIDYQVVVKGLEHKFGKQTAENEWEFRAFFDKIIQLPFMMPMGQYNIGKYVNSLLRKVDFIQTDLDEEALTEIIRRTIGGNPRSIKRLVNSVSLIQIFTQEKVDKDEVATTDIAEPEDEEQNINDEKFLLFSLLCLQIAYPPVYSLLTREPNFLIWDDNLAFKETNRSEEDAEGVFEREFENAKKSDNFDEDWEQSLYRICYVRPRLKPRSTDISKFFNYLKEEILQDRVDELGNIIADILSQTSVTSVTSTDQGQTILPEREGAYKRRILDGFDSWILDGTENKNANPEAVEFMTVLYNDLKTRYQEAEFLFTGGMSIYIAKHKFLKCQFESSKSIKNGTSLQLIRHFKDDYKMPKIFDIPVTPGRTFRSGKASTTHNADRYNVHVSDLTIYKKNRDILFSLIDKSQEMASDHWDKRLKIDYWKGSLTSASEAIQEEGKWDEENPENSFSQVRDLALKYLAPDYTYEVE